MTTDLDPQDHFLTMNGLRFHYLEWGSKDLEPVILLHGAWWHAHVWDTLASALCLQHRILALDQRGHGETDWADDYAWQRWIEDLEAFVTALNLQRFALVGHSMGGWIAYMFAAQHPELVSRLVVEDIGPDQRTPTLEQIQAQAAMLTDQVWAQPNEAIAAIREAVPLAREAELRYAVSHNLRPRPEGGLGWRYDTRRRSTGRLSRRPDAERQWEALRAIECPVLLMRGTRGILAADTAERMAAAIPDCRLVELPESGHNLHMENPEAFLQQVRDFLAEGSEPLQ
jgi:esterase